MKQFGATYMAGSLRDSAATVEFGRERLQIHTRNEAGEPVVVYWYYEYIIRPTAYPPEGIFVIRHEGYPPQELALEDRMFIFELENHMNVKSQLRVRKAVGTGAVLFRLVAALLVLFGLLYFLLVPFLAGKLAERVPVSYEVELGDQLYETLMASEKTDQQRTVTINRFFDSLAIPSLYPVSITVVKQDVANAFALPGGHIVVYDKLLLEMRHPEELAALLCHEFIHVQNRHSTRSLFRQMAGSVVLSFVFGNRNSIAGILIGNADQLRNLSYSRKLEKEADMEGLELLAERRIDGSGFTELFALLEKESAREGSQVAEWISSHPDLDKRIRYIRGSKAFNPHPPEIHPALDSLFFLLVPH